MNSAILRILTAARSESGPLRSENEDSYLVAGLDGDGWILAVADGVGGHTAGKEASQKTVDWLHSGVRSNPAIWPGLSSNSCIEELDTLIRTINRDIHTLGGKAKGRSRMASTLTCALISGSSLVVGHVGDSRLYRLREGNLERLTTDQTEAGERFAAGDITEEQERTYPRRNVIRQAIGTSPDKFAPVLTTHSVLPGDRYLLCSDGLTEGLWDKDIAHGLDSSREPDLHAALDDLIKTSLCNSGKDNTTAVAAEIQTR